MEQHTLATPAHPYRGHFVQMAAYHRWALSKVLAVVKDIPDEAYHKDMGLFFHSLHATLNHILLADRLWYGRFVGQQISITGLDQQLVADRHELSDALLQQATAWVELVSVLTDQELQGEFTYRDTKGHELTRLRGEVLDHVFNHGTHHRGQLSAAMTQLGYEWPQIDLLYFLPEWHTMKAQDQGVSK